MSRKEAREGAVSQELLSHLVSDALEGILAADLDGTILFSNATARRLLNTEGALLDGQPLGAVFPPASLHHLLPNVLRLARGAEGFEGELIMHARGGHPLHTRFTARPYPPGRPELLICRFLDWREVNALAQSLREASSLAVLGSLTRCVAHEILNPVTVIGANVRKMQAAPWAAADPQAMEDIIESVHSLESLVRTVEHFNSLPPPRFEKARLESALASALTVARDRLAAAGIAVTSDGTDSLPDLYLDPGLVAEALTAVVGNSLERMPCGGTLAIRGSWDGTWVSLVLEDTGPATDSDRLEEALSPVHVQRSLAVDLNLAVAQRVVEDHGGAMDVSSLPGGGLRVQIDLPADRRRIPRTAPI